jgi:hypothetical protein
VGLHGGLRDVDPLGDFLVGQAGRDQREHLAFAGGQVAEATHPPRRPRPGGELRDQPSGDGGGQERLTGRDHPDGPDQLGRVGVLYQKAGRARAEAVEDVLVQLERGQDDHVHAVQAGLCGDPAGRLDAVQARHPDVHQQHVGLLLDGQPHRRVAVRHRTHDADVVLRVQQRREPGPDQLLVIG